MNIFKRKYTQMNVNYCCRDGARPVSTINVMNGKNRQL